MSFTAESASLLVHGAHLQVARCEHVVDGAQYHLTAQHTGSDVGIVGDVGIHYAHVLNGSSLCTAEESGLCLVLA